FSSRRRHTRSKRDWSSDVCSSDLIAELTGMDLANSSLYDGGTALGEAVNLSHGQTKRRKIVVSKTVHPEYREVIRTYGKGFHLEVVEIEDRKSTRLNSSHVSISYAVFCLKKKKKHTERLTE